MNKNSKISSAAVVTLGLIMSAGLAGGALASQNSDQQMGQNGWQQREGQNNGQPPKFDGKMSPPSGTPKFGNKMRSASGTPKFSSNTAQFDNRERRQGGYFNTSTTNEAPNGIAGTVSSINSTTLTVSSHNNTVYTVDTSNATFKENKNDATLSNIQTGDMVIVQGNINDTAITASTVIKLDISSSTQRHEFKNRDGQDLSTSTVSDTNQGQHQGIINKVINKVTSFFKKLFGKK